MDPNLDSALRQYLRSGGTSKLFGSVFSILVLIVFGQLLSQIAQRFSPIIALSPVIRDPFTVLACAAFLFSRIDFDFMKFRLQNAGTATLTRDLLLAELEVPSRYRASFGNDVVMGVWKYRFAFVVLFGIAALRWVWTWSNT